MARTERLTLEGPEGGLEAVVTTPEQPAFRAVIAHPHPLYGGSMENDVVREATRTLLKAEGEVLRFNFRGVASSAGVYDGCKERYDLEAALRMAARDDGLPTVLAAYSFGSAMALGLLEDSSVQTGALFAGLLWLAPPLTHYDFTAVHSAPLPLGIVYGDADALTPEGHVRTLVDARGALPTFSRAVENAGHDLGTVSGPAQLRPVFREATYWLLEELGCPSPRTTD